MGKRLKLGKDCILRDRDGKAVARVESITLELLDDGDSWGHGADVVVGEEQQQLEGIAGVGGRAGASNSGDAAPKYDPIADVWSEYVRVMEPRKTDLDPGARTIIRDALKVADVDECKRAIRGCKASVFHMGDNDRGKKYNALSQILKGKRGGKTTREQINMFLDIEESSGLSSQVPSGDVGKINGLKREIIDAWEFPGDDVLQERAQMARQRLTDLGWIIGQDHERANSASHGFPTFAYVPPVA